MSGTNVRDVSAQGDAATVERVIPASPAAIFAIIGDVARHPDLDGSGQVRALTGPPRPLSLGATFGMAMRFGVGYTVVNTVVEYEQDRRIAWQTRPTGLMGHVLGGRTWRFELEPVEGGTLVRETWDISTERIRAMVRPGRAMTVRSMTHTLERIEQLLA
jgi:uncharacterized protein YndB with AHSA1/START domain